jgi:hypothetical protein
MALHGSFENRWLNLIFPISILAVDIINYISEFQAKSSDQGAKITMFFYYIECVTFFTKGPIASRVLPVSPTDTART